MGDRWLTLNVVHGMLVIGCWECLGSWSWDLGVLFYLSTLGYPFRWSKLGRCVTLVLARSVGGPWASSRPVFGPIRTAWTILSGCDGLPAWPAVRAVHRVASLNKRCVLGTHQGSVDAAHLTSNLSEFLFRFNRRRSRGMVFYRPLGLAVAHDPVRYRAIIADPTPKQTPPVAPRSRGRPTSLERSPANQPWRMGGQASASSSEYGCPSVH